MQQPDHVTSLGSTERKRVEAVVETLATLRSQGDSVAEVAHDARNMVTALGLYCDLLEEPGVLATPFLHYGNELRLVAAASRRLVEKLVALDSHGEQSATSSPADSNVSELKIEPAGWPETSAGSSQLEIARAERSRSKAFSRWDLMPAEPIDNLAKELLANRNLLAALAGPPVVVAVDTSGGAQPVRLTGEDLTRVLVNMVKNAAEAMPAGGLIQIGLRERPAAADSGACLLLTIEDNGPGVPENAIEKIFEAGFTTRARVAQANESWQAAHRGLGLSITRSIVEAAGGRITVSMRARTGACFEIELPVRSR